MNNNRSSKAQKLWKQWNLLRFCVLSVEWLSDDWKNVSSKKVPLAQWLKTGVLELTNEESQPFKLATTANSSELQLFPRGWKPVWENEKNY